MINVENLSKSYGHIKAVKSISFDIDDGDVLKPHNVITNVDNYDSAIPGFSYILTIAIILFAFSTMIAWSYYGLKSWTYLFGTSSFSENVFKVIFCIFVIIGSSVSLGSVLDLSDSMIFLMSVANLVGVYFLAGIVRNEIQDYMKQLRDGKIKRTDIKN